MCQTGTSNKHSQGQAEQLNTPTRELTVGELLDRRIDKAHRMVKCLTDIRENLPISFLSSGASRIQSLIEL